MQKKGALHDIAGLVGEGGENIVGGNSVAESMGQRFEGVWRCRECRFLSNTM